MYKILKNIIEMDDYSVQKLSKSQPPTPFQWNTVEGTKLNVDDCIGGKGKIAVKGNTEQQTYEGKNLFNINTIIESTYLDEYDVTGSSSVTNLSDYIEIVAEKAYTLSYKYATLLNSNKRNIDFYDVNKDFILGESYTPAGISHTLTTPNNAKYLRFSYDKNCNNIQLEQSSVVTDYEPYCGGQASPNPPYPQKIKKVTGDNKIKCTRKNLLPSTVFEFCTINSIGEKITGKSRICSDFIKVKKQQNYTLSSISQFGFLGIAFYDSNKKYIDRTIGNNIKSIKVSIPAQCSYVKVFAEYGSGTKQSIIAFKEHKMQLELGIATDYEEYEGKEFELSLGNIELCKIGDYKDVTFKNEQSSEYYNSNLLEHAWYKKNAINKVVDFAGSTGITIDDMVSNEDFFSECGGTINNKTITYDSAISASNTIYYPLATPTYEQITDETLIAQLESLNKAKWFKGVNHWWTETNNLEPVLKGTYRQAINE